MSCMQHAGHAAGHTWQSRADPPEAQPRRMHANLFSIYLALEVQQMIAHLHTPQERQVLSGQAVQIME